MLRCDVITLFPEMVIRVLESSMLKRAREKGLLEVKVHNLRDYTVDKHRVTDDIPYGGGAGMVMKAEPILRAVEEIRRPYEQNGETMRILFPSPQGRRFDQTYAQELAVDRRRLLILCGHYEGDRQVQLLALRFGEELRVIASGESAAAGKNNGRGDDWTGERTSAGFIQAGDPAISSTAGFQLKVVYRTHEVDYACGHPLPRGLSNAR